MSSRSRNLGLGLECPQPRRRGPGKKQYHSMSIEELMYPPADMNIEDVQAARIKSGYYPPLEKMLEWFPAYRAQVRSLEWIVPDSDRPASDRNESKSQRRRGKKAARTEPNVKCKADVGGSAERPTPKRRRRTKKATEPIGETDAVSPPNRDPTETADVPQRAASQRPASQRPLCRIIDVVPPPGPVAAPVSLSPAVCRGDIETVSDRIVTVAGDMTQLGTVAAESGYSCGNPREHGEEDVPPVEQGNYHPGNIATLRGDNSNYRISPIKERHRNLSTEDIRDHNMFRPGHSGISYIKNTSPSCSTNLVASHMEFERVLNSASASNGCNEYARIKHVGDSLADNMQTEKVVATGNSSNEYASNTSNGYTGNYDTHQEQSNQMLNTGNADKDYSEHRDNGYGWSYTTNQKQGNQMRSTGNAGRDYYQNTGSKYGWNFRTSQEQSNQTSSNTVSVDKKTGSVDYNENMTNTYTGNYDAGQDQSCNIRNTGNAVTNYCENTNNEYTGNCSTDLEQNEQMHNTGNATEDHGESTNNGFACNYDGDKEQSDQTNIAGNDDNSFIDNLKNAINDYLEPSCPNENLGYNRYSPQNSEVVNNECFEIPKIGCMGDLTFANIVNDMVRNMGDANDIAENGFPTSQATVVSRDNRKDGMGNGQTVQLVNTNDASTDFGFGKEAKWWKTTPEVDGRCPIIAGNSLRNLESVESNEVSSYNTWLPSPSASSSSTDWDLIGTNEA